MRERRRRRVFAEGWVPAIRCNLDRRMKTPPQPWSAVLEATMFSGWILRSLNTARGCVESSPSVDVAGHCQKRSHRRQQDLRLFALRFFAGRLRGADHYPYSVPGPVSPEAFEVGRCIHANGQLAGLNLVLRGCKIQAYGLDTVLLAEHRCLVVPPFLVVPSYY